MRFRKGEEVRFISHLNLTKTLTQALRRADLPVAHSHGFSPRPRISFGPALPLGMRSCSEFADVVLEEAIDVDQFKARLNEKLPPGLEILDVRKIPLKSKSLTATVDVATYKIAIRGELLALSPEELRERIEKLLRREEIPIERVRNKEVKKINLRPLILSLELESPSPLSLKMSLKAGTRPEEVVRLLLKVEELELGFLDIERAGIFMQKNGKLISPMRDSVLD
ncbi:TIGR03936 family radical SAM-associated protein [candidate division NPL-UPA2 bacterium]|nr:TIGR03936 family radical SAM-associated protein [candidate division NPL-UPA2 bacterium]